MPSVPLTVPRAATLLLALVLLPQAPAGGQDGRIPAAGTGERPSPSLHSRIDEVVAPYVAAGDFQGVVAVQRDGAAPLVAAYGLASVELETPHRPGGIFMIGSVSKQFTAAAILLLEQQGRLTTGDPLSRFLPAFPRGDEITLEQLLTHTSGVTDIYSLERFGATAGQNGTFEEVVDDLARAGLTFAPGTAYAYSNGGYALLAAVIERASGKSYGDFLEQAIFRPLGMTATAHDRPGPAVPGRVPGYDPWGERRLTPAPLLAPAYSTGSGSLWSSAADLLAWSEALHGDGSRGGRLLGEAAYRKMTRDHGRGYGYGVSVFRRFDRDVVGHDGRVSGYATDLARYLDDRTTVAVLSNVQSASRDAVRRAVAAVVFGEPVPPPEPRRHREPPADLAELTGSYSFGPGFTVSVRTEDGRLLARANQGGSSELIPVGETEWFSRMLYATVRFGRDEGGRVDRLIWGAGEGAPRGRRIR